MKRILINATQNEEIRVALCKGNHLYDFDLENRTREQKKSNIYKGHVTRVEPSLEAVFVEYGSQRQGFLPIREISAEYLSGNPRDENIKKLIKEGDELIVQVEKEERGNKGAALSTYVSLAGRYLVLMPNNPRGGGISRQISGKLREDMKRMLSNLDLPKGMSVIIRTAGIGKTQEDLQHDLNHLLNIWQAIQEQNQKYPSPRLVHQEAGVVTRAVRDYLRDDISEIWIDNENAYVEAAGFIDAVMPKQADKLRKYTDYEPMFARFSIEKQIETAYQREVRLPSGGSIVIDQTEALVSIDINSAKSTKGSDVAETAYHTNLEAADEIARQLRLRDMGGLIVIDFIDMNDNKHQKEVEKRLVDATKYDRARVQFGEISKFGLMEMSRQRLRPSLEESTGYICPRCHGNGMIRDLRSLSLSIMRQIEQIALKERQGEVQAEVPTDIAAFLLNEKRDSLVYLEQDSGTRITILPHAHLESPNFKLHFNRDGFAPSSYERITDTQQQEHSDLGYDVDWQTAEKERPEQQPKRQPRKGQQPNGAQRNHPAQTNGKNHTDAAARHKGQNEASQNRAPSHQPAAAPVAAAHADEAPAKPQPQAVAWLSNLFAKAPQAQTEASVSSHDAAEAIENLVNTGAQSLGAFGQVDNSALNQAQSTPAERQHDNKLAAEPTATAASSNDKDSKNDERRKRKSRKSRSSKSRQRREPRDETSDNNRRSDDAQADNADKRDTDNKRHNERDQQSKERGNDRGNDERNKGNQKDDSAKEQPRAKRKPHSQRSSRGKLERGETLTADQNKSSDTAAPAQNKSNHKRRNQDPNEVMLQVSEAPTRLKAKEVVHLSLDDSKVQSTARKAADKPATESKPTQSPVKVEAASGGQDNGHAPVSNEDSHKTDKAPAKGNAKPSAHTQASDDKAAEQPVPQPVPAAENTAPADTESKPVEPQSVETAKAQAPATADKAAPSNIAEAKPAEDKADTAAKAQQTVTPKAQDSSQQQPEATSTTPLELTAEALFATRYVTAQKFGQASNDPRIVRKQQSNSAVSQPAATSQAPIQGSVGTFIHAMLPEAQHKLANDGIIRSFIDALAAHQAHVSTDASANAGNDGNHDFDFSNYGYAALSDEYVTRFDTMTQAVSQFAIAAGKTTAEPRPIGKRASNDPRGQHPEHVDTADVSTAHDDHVQNSAPVEADEVVATALTGQSQADAVSHESEHLLEADQALSDQALADQIALKDDAQSGKSKTTIASYKNMIENVAEQLLPQTGMFNLTTPKVPKARSRKPKVEHKKPTQAEKIENEGDKEDTEKE